LLYILENNYFLFSALISDRHGMSPESIKAFTAKKKQEKDKSQATFTALP
jgi:hypothetical protein